MALIKTLKKIVNKGASYYSSVIVKLGRLSYSRSYSRLPVAEGEKKWTERWRQLQKHPSVNCYRKYAGIVDTPSDIIPIDLMNTVIQPILNPNLFRPVYLDKNSFDKIYGSHNLPVTIARRIDGAYFAGDYTPITDRIKPESLPGVENLIAKPSRDSYGGRNILLFNRNEMGKYVWNEDPSAVLSLNLLDNLLGENWVLQHKMRQHPFMAQFNESSVNTFRVHVYCSPVTGQADVAAICMRVGAKGNWFDNIHSGGFCVKVDLETGKIGSLASDWKGDRTENTNGIDLERTEFFVPNFPELKKFAIEMGKKVLHHHSLAMDIMMDIEGNFKLIEVNIGTFDANMFMATGTTAFGKYTDEVIEYCRKRRNKVKFVHVIPW